MLLIFKILQLLILVAVLFYGLGFIIKDSYWLNLTYFFLLANISCYSAYDHNRALSLNRNVRFGSLSYNPLFITSINLISFLSFVFSIIFYVALGIKTSWLNSIILFIASLIIVSSTTAILSLIIPITTRAFIFLISGIILMYFVLLELHKVFF